MADKKIIQRVKKLLELADHAKNNNVEEAAAAASKAQALIERHRIDAEMLNRGSSGPTWKTLKDKGNPSDWKLYLATILSKHNGCYVVKSPSYDKDGEAWVIGETEDSEIVQDMYSYLVGELTRFCIAELLQVKMIVGSYPDPSYTKSYYLGAISSLEKRLIESKEAVRQEIMKGRSETEKTDIGGALARIDNRAERAKEWVKDKVKAQIKEVHIASSNAQGYMAGERDGKNLNIKPNGKALPNEK